jgi:hypothetical protein
MSENNNASPFKYSYSTSTIGASNTTEAPIDSNTTSDIPTMLAGISAERKRLLMEEGKLLEKGLMSNDPDVLMKANQHWEDVRNRQDSGIKSTIVDPYEFNDSLGFKNKPSGMSFEVMRKMADIPMIRSVITTRQAQVSSFAYPQKNKFDTGFVIQKKEKYFAAEQEDVTDKDRAKMNEIAEFLINGGKESNSWDGDTFDTFLKKLVEDTLTLDQGCFEIVRNNFGEPQEFLAIDGATVRMASTYTQDENFNLTDNEQVRGYFPKYVQIVDGEVKNQYYPWEMCVGIRNATTNIYSNGYGKSELEVLVQIVTWMLYGDQYNGNFFSQGASPKGFLKVAGNVNANRIQEFRQQWNSLVAGVRNSWKTPIIESDKMEWVDLQKNNTDMQFEQWQTYLLKVVCAVYKISPEELGFSVGSTGGGSAMFESGNESKLKYSRDKGLKPLLKSIEFWINKWIVAPIDNDFEFKFVGLEAEDETKALENDIKRVGSFMSLKEVRRRNDLPEEIDADDVILNSVWQQANAMKQMQGQQQSNDEAVEEDGPGVWEGIDEDENDMDFEEPDEAEKAAYYKDPFQYELNQFIKGLGDE